MRDDGDPGDWTIEAVYCFACGKLLHYNYAGQCLHPSGEVSPSYMARENCPHCHASFYHKGWRTEAVEPVRAAVLKARWKAYAESTV